MRMMLRKGGHGAGLARSMSQIAVSVVATLVATSLYGALRDEDRPLPTAPAPSLTSGGKFDARIAGAAMPAPPDPVRPLLTAVDWSAAPPPVPAPTMDVVWRVPAVDKVVFADPAQKPARHILRHAAPAAAPALPPVRPAILAEAPPHQSPASPDLVARVASAPGAVWSLAAGTMGTLVSYGGSAMAATGSTLGRLIP